MRKPFEDVFEDQTKLGTKVQTDEYHESGAHIIVDQGQEQIAGYTDREEGIFSTVPAIIFGDHTRIIKFVDEPFFLGADGVKVLRCKLPGANYRYLYYALRHAKIPNTGYNRHFKWLKEIQIPYPDVKQQDQIVTVLDGISRIISARQRQLRTLDTLIKARFVEMFGDLVRGDKISTGRHKIGEIAAVTKLAGFEFTEYIHYQTSGDIIMLRGLNCKGGKLILDDIKWIDKATSDLLPRSKLYKGDILMTYAGTIGEVGLVDADDRYHLAPNVGKITINDTSLYDPIFMVHLFMYTHDYIMTFASQSSQASISMGKIREFEYYFPPIGQQRAFAAFVTQVDKSKAVVQQALDKAQLLFNSLMQQYFG